MFDLPISRPAAKTSINKRALPASTQVLDRFQTQAGHEVFAPLFRCLSHGRCPPIGLRTTGQLENERPAVLGGSCWRTGSSRVASHLIEGHLIDGHLAKGQPGEGP